MIYSFDIFDTCLVRSCGSRKNFLYLLARKVLGENESFERQRDFVRKRLEIEHSLYINGIEAPVIHRIYDNMSIDYYTKLNKECIIEQEWQLEIDCLLPVIKVKSLIEQCRKKGIVMFISDMYFPESKLRTILEKYDLIRPSEKIYVSCDYGASKSTGRLFNIVKDTEHINVKHWEHFGDDFNNDFYRPKILGIKPHLIDNGYSQYENYCNIINPCSFDKISPSVFAGIMRAIRISFCKNDDDGGFLSNVMCGILLPFVCSCLRDAELRGIKRLYFASRDAYVMLLAAKKLLPSTSQMELKYIHLSTRVIYPTIIKEGKESEIREILNKIQVFTPIAIMKMLGLNENEVVSVSSIFDVNKTCIYGDKDSEKLIEILLGSSNINQIKEHGESQTRLLLAYLEQEGFITSNDIKVGLVDIGWGCNSQKYLSRIIPCHSANNTMYYYLGVVDNNVFEESMGDYKSYLYTDISNIEHPKFLECYICKNHETTVVGYKKDSMGLIRPVFSNAKIPDKLLSDFAYRKQIIEQSAELYSYFPCLVQSSNELFNLYSTKIIGDFLIQPPSKMVKFLASRMEWDHYVSSSNIIRKYSFSKSFFNIVKRKLGIRTKISYVYYWTPACISFTYGDKGLKLYKYFGKLIKNSCIFKMHRLYVK